MVGHGYEGDAERGMVVDEQPFLQAAGEVTVPLVRVDHDSGDGEDMPGCRELLDAPGESRVESLPPGTVATYGRSEGAPDQRGGLRDQHREPRG